MNYDYYNWQRNMEEQSDTYQEEIGKDGDDRANTDQLVFMNLLIKVWEDKPVVHLSKTERYMLVYMY